jgi:hypothetical protein
MYTCDLRWWMKIRDTCCTIHKIPNKKRLMCDLKKNCMDHTIVNVHIKSLIVFESTNFVLCNENTNIQLKQKDYECNLYFILYQTIFYFQEWFVILATNREGTIPTKC